MTNNVLKLALSLATLTLLTVACKPGKKDTAASSGSAAPQALPVDVTVVKSTNVEQTESIAGTIVANQSVPIMSELTKKIVSIHFKDGSFVKKGQLLYKLDDADIRARMKQAEAELQLARLNESRLGELYKTESVRREEYDAALAKLQFLEAAIELLQVELAKTNIKAPFSGVAGITKVYPGTLVSPGMPMVVLQEEGQLKIQFTVSEKYLPLIKSGKTVRYTTELHNQPETATIVSTESGLDQQSRSITVQAIAPNRQGQLKAGMSAKVYFNTAGAQNAAIRIPTEALIPGADGYSVFVVKNGAATMKQVSIVNRNEKEAIVSKGIGNGDTVMISNILRAGEGVPVAIVSTN